MTSVSVGANNSGATTARTAVAGASPIPIPHAVSRSKELLSCAKTALKIVKANNAATAPDSNSYNALVQDMSVESLRLQNTSHAPPQSVAVMGILEDGLTLLRAMEFGLKQLHGLVRRRGHTNDPTMEIAVLVQQLEQDYKELEEFCQQLVQRASGGSSNRRSSKQAKKHWELVATWFKEVASHQSVQLKEVLKLRGTVLADQAQRRKQVQQKQQQQQQDPNQSSKTTPNGTTTKHNPSTPTGRKMASSSRRPIVTASATATPLFDSPLFTATQKKQQATNQRNGTSSGSHSYNNYNQSTATSSTPLSTYPPTADTTSGTATASSNNGSNGVKPQSSYYSSGGYGGATTAASSTTTTTAGYGYGGAGGGGYYGGASSTGPGFGMRQRKAGSSFPQTNQPNDEDEPKEHSGKDASTYVQQQIQEREVKRQTAQRLAESRQAERTLGELGHLFGKMSTLITQQGEVLEKVEDDVEAALVDVTAGQEELTTTLSLKKGNRPLIIKTFLILNFFVVFMKLYKK